MAIGIGLRKPVVLGQANRLDHGEPLGAAVVEVALGLLATEAVEEFPGRVAQIEKRRPVGVNHKSAVGGDLQVAVREVPRGPCAGFLGRGRRDRQARHR
jgi:hypothetical protein